MRYTLMHMSDLHAGPPFMPRIADAAATYAHEVRPDLLVISGDLVQRAIFPQQWRSIRNYIARLPQPQLLVPGNHDIPLLDGFSRVFAPTSYYRRYISSDLNPVFSLPGLAVVGGNSAHGITVDGGYVNQQQQRTLADTFARFDADTCKIAVLHHPLVNPPGRRRKGKMSNASTVLRLLERCNVELYLCGHFHISYIDAITGTGNIIKAIDEQTGYRIILCHSGTTTSRRGRGTDRSKNSLNVIEIDKQTIRITPHFYLPEEQRFAALREHVFRRWQHAG